MQGVAVKPEIWTYTQILSLYSGSAYLRAFSGSRLFIKPNAGDLPQEGEWGRLQRRQWGS